MIPSRHDEARRNEAIGGGRGKAPNKVLITAGLALGLIITVIIARALFGGGAEDRPITFNATAVTRCDSDSGFCVTTSQGKTYRVADKGGQGGSIDTIGNLAVSLGTQTAVKCTLNDEVVRLCSPVTSGG